MNHKIITIGSATVDIFIRTEKTVTAQYIHEKGGKIEISALHYSTGGGATNAAVSFNRQGFEVQPVCAVGDDHEAHYIREQLVQYDVPVDTIVATKAAPTGRSFIFRLANNENAIFTYRGANAHVSKQLIPFDALQNSDAVYISSLVGVSAEIVPHLVNYACSNNVFVAANPGGSQLKDNVVSLLEALPYIDVFTLNREEATTLLQTFSVDTVMPEDIKELYFKELLSRGVKIVIMTDGARGVYAATQTHRYFCPSLAGTTITNTVGAGDAFGSAFIAAILQKKSIEEALVQGCLNSASVLQGIDAKEGLLTQEQINERLQINGTAQVKISSIKN